MGVAHGSAQEAEVNSRPPLPPNLRWKRFNHHQHAPHPYAMLLGNRVAVDVDSFPYLWDEHMMFVSYIYKI